MIARIAARLGPLLVLFIVNAFIFADLSATWRYLAALMVLSFLSGWVWIDFFLRPNRFPESVELTSERILFAVGLSLSLTILLTLTAVYLPCPLTRLNLLIPAYFFGRSVAPPQTTTMSSPLPLPNNLVYIFLLNSLSHSPFTRSNR